MPGDNGGLAGRQRSKVVAAIAATAAAAGNPQCNRPEGVMSKGLDQKKSDKKQPTKTLKEKRAAKKEKKK
ncbi:hypothetical protein [Xanthomonas translucens]|uniref:Uncharacterized protein n=8 Tax=Xanthomonas translucens group TaxID=3390202 RepID=A0A109HM26_XANCT|nr:hypothetical protein [Xanthomonas translucens]KTF40422.1 hypothetical protein OZ12_06865 [Xanthomonas translucens pv. translucens]KWV14628.1 hypothetical protein ATB53_13285 [Xanthomonas translucens]KWV14659.1 hypothetical protein ATB54_11640 [Xanthomonas translucens]MBC3973933.1 hypothetical protein [Xanthomonas translucens pv. undulosa]MCS3360000.1 hypothetical protein [Xanthomonas translucens pv. translucens]